MKAGKTVFLTCLYYYGSTLDPEHQVTAERGEEIIIGKYLRTLRRRKWPSSTGRKELNSIILSISERKQDSSFGILDKLRKKRVTFQVPDYAGQLLTLPNSPEPGILAKIRNSQELSPEERKIVELIKEARGYILVFDPELPEVSKQEAEYDRDLLQMDYTTLVNELGRSGILSRPILVLTTKWDLAKEQSCEEYVGTQFPTIARHLKTKCQTDKLDFAAVWLENDDGGPKLPLEPKGYRDVLNWIIKVLA